MKKHIAFVIALAMLCTIFSACSFVSDTVSVAPESIGDTDVSEQNESQEVSEAESEAESEVVSETPSEPEESAGPREYRIVALGDSITAGYGLDNAETQRYTSLLKSALQSDTCNVSIDNYAVSGHTSSNLLSLLNNGTASTLADADAVILCIGANNVLAPVSSVAYTYLSGCQSTLSSLFAALLKGNDITPYQSTLVSTFNNFAAALESDSTKTAIQNGLATLTSDLPKIIAAIRDVNPDCDIYFGNIYNPYAQFDVSGIPGVTYDFAAYSDSLVCSINDIIAQNADTLGYTVADVYSAFKTHGGRLVNATLNITTATFNYDPHPNAQGHVVIASVYEEIFDKILAE